MVIFRAKSRKIEKKTNFRISGQRIIPKKQVKYLGLIIDEHLTWEVHLTNLQFKLNRTIGMLSKIRHYVSLETLKVLYFSIFHSHLIYGCQIWGQVLNTNLSKTQNKALRIICFKNRTASSNPLYSDLKILRYHDYVELLNCLFVYDLTKSLLPKAFQVILKYVDHKYSTRSFAKKHLQLPLVKSTKYGLKSITYNAINTWNKLQNKNTNLEDLKRNELKRLIYNNLLNKYQN